LESTGRDWGACFPKTQERLTLGRMHALIVSIHVKPSERDRFLAAAEDNAVCSVRDEPGCLRFDVLQDQTDQHRFIFHEVYQDEAAFEAHLQTPHFARWRVAAADVREGASERATCEVVFPRDYR
jgi:autoinducer 2-degrading protein